MKKSSKGFILIGAAVIAIGIGTLSQLTVPMNGNIEKEDAKTYSHTASNILDNTFLDGNNIILPFIFDNAKVTITADEIKSEFAKRGFTVKNISTTEIGTGTQITVEENSNVYNVVVYGDVDGDGIINLGDAQNVILHYLKTRKEPLSGLYEEAARTSNQTGNLNLGDAQRIILFYLGRNMNPTRLVVDEPAANNGTPVIKLNGNNNLKVKYGSTYNDAGVTVTDISDKNIKAQTTGKIDTKKLGKQTITYTAKNFSGKDATATRTVEVVDYIQKLEITKPNKTIYKYGEKLDLTGGKITLVKASGDRSQVIDMTSDKVKVTNYDSNGKVTVTYTYNDPLTNVATNVSSTFSVTVRPLGYDEAPVITLKGKQNDIVKYQGTYTDPGATVTDAIDKNITIKTTGKIDTETLGKQTITYTATNSRGKVTTVIRTVEVVDYVEKIQIAEPSKKIYVEGEKLDKTGGKVTPITKSGISQTAIDMTSSTVTVSNFDANGKVTVTYPYKDPVTGKTTNITGSFNVTLNYIQSIEIKPDRTEYQVGDTVPKDGIKVIAIRKDKTEEDITSDKNLTITTPTSAALNNKTITATYIDKNNKKHTATYEITVSLRPVSTVNIKTEKVVSKDGDAVEKVESTSEGDLRSTFKLTLTQKDTNEEDIPVGKINWVITDNDNNDAVVASKANPNNNFVVTVSDKTEQQENGMSAAVMYFKILAEGNYKITITLDEYPETVKGTSDIKVAKSLEVSKIILDEGNSILSEPASGVRTLAFEAGKDKEAIIPLEFKHIYPDGEVENNPLVIYNTENLKLKVTDLNGKSVDYITCKLYNTDTQLADGDYSVKGIKIKSSKIETVKLTITLGKVTQEYQIKIDESAALPLLEENKDQTITFYSEEKPGNDMVKEDNGDYFSLIPISLADGTKLKAVDINSEEYYNTTGKVTITGEAKGNSISSDNIYVLFYGENKELISLTDSNWRTKDVWYIGLSTQEDLAEGNIIISYKPQIEAAHTQTIKVKVMGEITTMSASVTGKQTANNTIQEDLRPYGVFELLLAQKDGEEDIPISNLLWEVRDTQNGNVLVASGKGTEQTTGYTGSDKITRNDYIKLTKVPELGSSQEVGRAVKMSFKVLKTGSYKMTVKLENYSEKLKAEMNFNVEPDSTITGFILDENNDAIKPAGAGKDYDYELPEHKLIPITYVHEYTDEETGKKVPEAITNAYVNKNQLGVQLDGIEYKLYMDETTESGETEAINYIELNASEEVTVTLKLTLKGVTKTYKIHIAPEAATKPVLQTVNNGQKVETISLYDTEPADKTLVGYLDGEYFSLIPISYTNRSLKPTEITNEVYGVNGNITVSCVKDTQDLSESIAIELFDTTKGWIDIDNDPNYSKKDVGYIGIIYAGNNDITELEDAKIIIKDTASGQTIPVTIVPAQ